MSGEEVTVEMYVRSSAPGVARERQERTRERLASLDEEGAVGSVTVRQWPKRVALDDDPEQEWVLDRFEAFSRWAEAENVSLDPGFGTRECYSWATGYRYDALVLPVICLAVYEGGDLVSVYPHADGDETRTVADYLIELETAATEEPTAAPEPQIKPAD